MKTPLFGFHAWSLAASITPTVQQSDSNNSMKTFSLVALTISVAALISTDAQPAPVGASSAERMQQAGYQAVQRAQNKTVWSRAVLVTNELGAISLRTDSFTEIGSGLTRLQSAHYVPAAPELTITNGGILAHGAGHLAFFADNLNTRTPCQIKMPNGQWLKTRFIGLAYHDVATGTNVFLAEVKDAAAQIVGAKSVVYADAFDTLKCDVRYSYTAAGVSQDIIVRERPPRPEDFARGLHSASTHLVAITEIIEGPEPTLHERSWRSGREQVRDQTLDFGSSMRMVPGRAFQLNSGSRQQGIPVSKQYEVVGARR